MSKFIFSAMLFLVLTTSVFSQQINSSKKFSSEDYMKKSKKQETFAWVLLGGGVVLVATGFAIGMNEVADDLVGAIFFGEEQQSSSTGGALFTTGLASMAGSIPLFIASSKNRQKAKKMAVVLKMEKSTCFQQQQLFKQISYPALSVKIIL